MIRDAECDLGRRSERLGKVNLEVLGVTSRRESRPMDNINGFYLSTSFVVVTGKLVFFGSFLSRTCSPPTLEKTSDGKGM